MNALTKGAELAWTKDATVTDNAHGGGGGGEGISTEERVRAQVGHT